MDIEITVMQAKELREKNPSIQFVDVREPVEVEPAGLDRVVARLERPRVVEEDVGVSPRLRPLLDTAMDEATLIEG